MQHVCGTLLDTGGRSNGQEITADMIVFIRVQACVKAKPHLKF